MKHSQSATQAMSDAVVAQKSPGPLGSPIFKAIAALLLGYLPQADCPRSRLALPSNLGLQMVKIILIRPLTHFQRRVCEIVSTIPSGETRTYRWVAEKLGNPKAIRAVGQALKKNPLPGIIPCHRVIRSDGSPGGFSKGEEKKRQLLLSEKKKQKNLAK